MCSTIVSPPTQSSPSRRRGTLSRGLACLTILYGLLALAGCPQGSGGSSQDLPDSAKAPAAPTLSMAAVAKPGTAAKPVKPKRPTQVVLEEIVRKYCVDGSRPWALAHALIALGPDVKMPSGKLAIDFLASRYIRKDDEGRWVFAVTHSKRNPWPHPGMFSKVLLGNGVSLDRQLPTKVGGTVTLRALVKDMIHGYEPSNDLYNEAWKLEGEAAVGKPDRIAELAKHSLDTLAYHQAYLEEYLHNRTRVWEKPFVVRNGRRAPTAIHRYFCGGCHLFQAVQQLHGKELPPRLKLQYDILLLRFDLESDYWDTKLGEARAHGHQRSRAKYERLFLSQKLKMQGHILETYVKGVELGAIKMDEEAKTKVAAAYERLAATVATLDQQGIYDQMDSYEARELQVYLDLIGDTAHALHAWQGRKVLGL